MRKTKLMVIALLATVVAANANLVNIGNVSFTGEFTLNHLYDFNHPNAQPYGWFGDQTVVSSGGIFSPIHAGDVLGGQALWSVGNLPLFSMRGFTFLTLAVEIAGADSHRYVAGSVDLFGNGYQNDNDYIGWNFFAPSSNPGFLEDITGEITLVFTAVHENGHVPDGGSTILLMSAGMAVLGIIKRKV